MKILLVQPEDSPCLGPWVREKWDLVVDLGKSSAFTRASWQERLNLPILQLDSLPRGTQDFDSIRELLRTGRNHLVDELGLDWWDLISVFIYAELEEAVLLGRLAGQLDATAELYSTRPGWPANGVALLRPLPVALSYGCQAARSEKAIRPFAQRLHQCVAYVSSLCQHAS